MNSEIMINKIYSNVEELVNSEDTRVKNNVANEVIESMKTLDTKQIVDLMADSNELVRNMASRVYVECHFDKSLDFLCDLLNNDDEKIRDSAVISICYMNSPENLEILKKATEDKSNSIKLRAITGIADLAVDYANKQAKELLQTFVSSEDTLIREFVNDELSLLPA